MVAILNLGLCYNVLRMKQVYSETAISIINSFVNVNDSISTKVGALLSNFQFT